MMLIDMNSWERFSAVPHPSLAKIIRLYHRSCVMLLTHNIRQKMIAELLYPDIKVISAEKIVAELQCYLTGRKPGNGRLLTPRQEQIILLLSSGTGRKETRALLKISVKTVSAHLRCVLGKASFKKLSYFCAAITPYAPDFSAASLRVRMQLKR